MSIPNAYVAVTNDLNQDQRMHRICNTLIKSGYKVTLIGRKKKESEKLYSQAFLQHRISMTFQHGILFYLEYQLRLFLYLLFAPKADLLCSVDLDTVLAVSFAAKCKGSATVYDAHELFTEVPELQNATVKKSIWTLAGKMTIKHFDLRITVNKSLANLLSKKYQCDFEVIRNLPIAKPNMVSSLPVDSPFIWYQGVLNEGRGLQQMIEALSSIPNVDLRIAGEGDLSQSLRELAANSAANERIYFHSWMNADQMHDWASNAWLGINLLEKSAGNYYYSLANRTFDYVQAQLPALHMDFPEYREVLDTYKVGILLDDLSVNALIEIINELRVDSLRYKAMKVACKEAKEVLTWEKEENKLMQLVEVSCKVK